MVYICLQLQIGVRFAIDIGYNTALGIKIAFREKMVLWPPLFLCSFDYYYCFFFRGLFETT